MQNDSLKLDVIQENLSPLAAACFLKLHVFDVLNSTNAWLLSQSGCGWVCVADQQTAGRGRRGRTWLSPSGGNVYLSVRWCFEGVPRHLSMLGLITGLAVADALAECGVQGHGVKWPNDIYIHNKKLGGILLEVVGNLQQVVVGIGLNVNRFEDSLQEIEQPWTSLDRVLGTTVERNVLIGVLLNHLAKYFQAFPALDMAQFQRDWQRWDVLYQRPVRVLAGTEVMEGIACGVDPNGQLRLLMESGTITTFSSADVSVRM